MDVLFAILLVGVVAFYMYKTQKNRQRFKLERVKLLQGDGVKRTLEERKKLLEKFTLGEISRGWRLISQSDEIVILEYGKRPNHILHFLLCIPTFGLWLIVWLLLSFSMNIKRKTYSINEFGVIQEQLSVYTG
jgi:hypothetical protein